MESSIDYLKNRMSVDSVSGCWNWNKSLDSYRYGSAWLNGKKILAHRASYQAFIGEIPLECNVCHKCDNGRCINPDHLFLGSQKDNMIDASMKGRFKGRHQSFGKGENHTMAKLSEKDVLSIKEKLRIGIKQKVLAVLFGVKQCTIADISIGRRWKHIGV